MKFTRREKHVLAISAFILFIFSFIPQQTIEAYELLYLICVVIPIVGYLVTDPDRRKAG